MDGAAEFVGDGKKGAHRSATGSEPVIFVLEIRALLSGRGERALDENGLKIGVSAASARVAVLAGALVVAGTRPGPGGEVSIGWEAGEIWTDLRKDLDGSNAVDAIDRAAESEMLLVWCTSRD